MQTRPGNGNLRCISWFCISKALGWPLKIKVGKFKLSPSQIVPLVIKTNCAKYFWNQILFRGAPLGLKF
jgi:hypothetical protein